MIDILQIIGILILGFVNFSLIKENKVLKDKIKELE